jgi:hypothetical protein
VTVTIGGGKAVAYRVFDVAEEFDLAAAERIVQSTYSPSRLRLARATGHSLVVRNAPMTMTLPPSAIRMRADRTEADVVARIWDYGVISMQFHIPLPAGLSWDSMLSLAEAIEEDNDIDEVARLRVREVAQALAPAAKLPHAVGAMEDYVIYQIERVDGVASTAALLETVDIPALILGERKERLSERTRDSIRSGALSYSESDLAVIDWNSAFLVEPAGSRDVADMIEFAVTHLTEFRCFDELLDERLERLYDEIQRERGGFFRSEYVRLSREANALYIEFSDYVDRVDNSLKFVGDFYLATVFRTAVNRFHMREWEESVTRKMNTVARVSELLHAEVNVRRGHVLEIIVIVLIVLELLSALFKFA